MRRSIQISKARVQLSHLLKQIQKNSDTVFEITVNNMVLGELRAPEAMRFHVKPGKALLEAMETMGQPEVSIPEGNSTAREHDSYLYENK